MLKTFIFGVLLGIAALVAGLYAYPVVDQHREASITSVAPNGGTRESFYIDIPVDRVMLGLSDNPVPAELDWPGHEALTGVRAELFKLRDSRDSVIGIASRTANDEVVDWVIHLPARGSLFFNMPARTVDGGGRVGELRTGTHEFSSMTGSLIERWVADTSAEGDAPAGRLELHTTYVGQLEPLE